MKKQWFENKLFRKFFLPALLSSLGLAATGIADGLYIGQTLGESGLFISGATAPIYMILTTIATGFAVGGSIHYAAAVGEGDEKRGSSIFVSTVMSNFFVILLLSAAGFLLAEPLAQLLGCERSFAQFGRTVGYLRLLFAAAPIIFMQAPLQYFVHTDGAPGVSSAALLVGTAVDCLVGFLLIVCMRVGIYGSVWASLCGAVAMEGVCAVYLLGARGNLRLKSAGKPSIKAAGQAFATGMASATQYLYQFIILFVFNRVLLAISDVYAVAIFDVVNNAAALVIAVIDAVVLAMIPILSAFYGERNSSGVYRSVRIALTVGLLFVAAFSGCMILFAEEYCRLFGLSAYAEQGTGALGAVLGSMLFGCGNAVCAAYFQNTGQARISYLIMALRGAVILLPCGLICAMGGYGMFWWCYAITELLVLLSCMGIVWGMRRRGLDLRSVFAGCTVFSETIDSETHAISDTCERLQRFLEENGADAKKAYLVTLTVDEICRLIAEKGDRLMLQLTVVKENGRYTLHIRDNACRFNPFETDEADETVLGLRILRKQAQTFRYRRTVGFNTLTVMLKEDAASRPGPTQARGGNMSELRKESMRSVKTAVNIEELPTLTGFVEQTLEEADASPVTVIKMNIALDEIFSNIVKFSGASYVEITCGVENGMAFLAFEDDGEAYDPLQEPEAEISGTVEERMIGGLGIHMVKKSMDEMEYVRRDEKNMLILRKEI